MLIHRVRSPLPITFACHVRLSLIPTLRMDTHALSGDLSVEAEADTLNAMWECHPDRDMPEDEAQRKSEAGLLKRF